MIAHKPTHREEAAVKSATSAVNLDTSLAPAPSQRVLGVATVTATVAVAAAAAVVVVVAAVAAETTTLSEVGVEKPGMIDHLFFIINSRTHMIHTATLAVVLGTFLATVSRVPSVTTVLDSYELGLFDSSPATNPFPI